MRAIIQILFLSILLQSQASNWYIDNSLGSGSNNGTSWANAWRNRASVSYTSVAAGDVIYVSGGAGWTATQTYDTNNWGVDFRLGKDGSSGGGYVIFRPGSRSPAPTGHDGVVVFDGVQFGMNTSNPQWNWLDGGRSASFVAPTNYVQVTNGTTCITNNIGFVVKNLYGQDDADTSPVLWFFHNPNNIKFSYIEVYGLTNNATFQFHETRGTVCYAAVDTGTTTNIFFEYIYAHDNSGQVISWSGGDNAATFDEKVFKFGWLPMNSEDHFETSGGWTIRDSVVGPCSGYSVHNDFFQFTGDYIKVYNNWIGESQNSIMRVQTLSGLRHNIYFFNNLCTEKQGRAVGGGTAIEPICFVHYDPDHPAATCTYSNILMANNLFYNSVLSTTVIPPHMALNPIISWTKGSVTNCFIKKCYFVNNISLDKENGIGFPGTRTAFGSDYYEDFTTNDFVLAYNTISSTNTTLTNPRRIVYLDLITNVGFGPYWWSNMSTNNTAFFDRANDIFELSPSDEAVNGGTNMSSWFNFDALNRPRNVGGAWDKGPLEYQVYFPPDGVTRGALAILSFDDDFTSATYITDYSGSLNHAYRFGFVTDPAAPLYTNFPLRVANSSVSGGVGSGYMGSFDWFNDGYGAYGRSGRYAGITNYHAFTNMTAMTIMCWAKHNAAHSGLDYSSDANETLLSSGDATGDLGTWTFGRINENIHFNETRFSVTTNAVGFEHVLLNFPDNNNNFNESTTNLNHYAVTFQGGASSGTIKLYFNGAPVSTNTIPNTYLTVGHSNARPYDWIGIGVNTHVGTPMLNDESPSIEYPNNGWENGYIDDVRIYNRALLDAEIASIKAGTNYFGGGNSGGGGGSGSATAFAISRGRITSNTTLR